MRRGRWLLLAVASIACNGSPLGRPQGTGATNAQGGDDEYGRNGGDPAPPPSPADDAGTLDAADVGDAEDVSVD